MAIQRGRLKPAHSRQAHNQRENKDQEENTDNTADQTESEKSAIY